MLLKDAYGPGVVAGSLSLFMYVSMVVAESLLARTFGTYLLTPFGLQGSVVLVPLLGILAIAGLIGASASGNGLFANASGVQWALIRRLRNKVHARRWVLALATLLDVVVLAPFVVLKVQSDVVTIIVAFAVAAIVVVAQVAAVRVRR